MRVDVADRDGWPKVDHRGVFATDSCVRREIARWRRGTRLVIIEDERYLGKDQAPHAGFDADIGWARRNEDVTRDVDPDRDTRAGPADVDRNADSIAQRMARLSAAEKRCRYVATGFAGLVLFLGADGLATRGPMLPVLVTLIVIGVACLGMSVVTVIVEQGHLEVEVADRARSNVDPAGPFNPWPHHWYSAGLVILGLAGAFLIFGVWLWQGV